VFRQIRRDADILDSTLDGDRAFAVGPFGRLRADTVLDAIGKTRGAINNLWGSQEAFRAAVMHLFLNDETLGVDEVDYPDPSLFAGLDAWVSAWAQIEIERGPRHGMQPENRYGLRWVTWLGLVPYGVWSTMIADVSMEEYRSGVARFATDILEPALTRFSLSLTESTTIEDLAVATSSLVEGFWLNAALTPGDPIGRPGPISAALASGLLMLIHGATTARSG
jgi:hypothetical protein